MLKQLKLTELCFGKYRVDLYHDGEKASSEEYWDGEEFDNLLEKYEIEGYDKCYTEEEVKQGKKVFEIRSKNVIGGPKEWEFIGQDDNDMPMYKCPMCGRPLIRTAYQAYITLLIFIKNFVIIYM